MDATRIYIVIDSTKVTGEESIKGVFYNKQDAKLFLADYVLENEVDTDCIDLVEREVK